MAKKLKLILREAHSSLLLFLISSFQSGLYSVGPYKEKEALISSKSLKKAPSFQEVFEAMLLSDSYSEIFPEVYNLAKILLALPVVILVKFWTFLKEKK